MNSQPAESQQQNPPKNSLFESSPWVSQAKEHWKQFRPKMYAELQEAGLASREGGEGSRTDTGRPGEDAERGRAKQRVQT